MRNLSDSLVVLLVFFLGSPLFYGCGRNDEAGVSIVTQTTGDDDGSWWSDSMTTGDFRIYSTAAEQAVYILPQFESKRYPNIRIGVGSSALSFSEKIESYIDIASLVGSHDQFGHSIAASTWHDMLVVGAPAADQESGSVHVFRKGVFRGDPSVTLKIDAENFANYSLEDDPLPISPGDRFGESVRIVGSSLKITTAGGRIITFSTKLEAQKENSFKPDLEELAKGKVLLIDRVTHVLERLHEFNDLFVGDFDDDFADLFDSIERVVDKVESLRLENVHLEDDLEMIENCFRDFDDLFFEFVLNFDVDPADIPLDVAEVMIDAADDIWVAIIDFEFTLLDFKDLLSGDFDPEIINLE